MMLTMESSFDQKLSPGDLVHVRDWDETKNDWVVIRDQVFMVVDVKHDSSSDQRNRDIVSILRPGDSIIESYAGYFVKAST